MALCVYFCCYGARVSAKSLRLLVGLDEKRQSCKKATGITREEGLQNGESVRKVSFQHTT